MTADTPSDEPGCPGRPLRADAERNRRRILASARQVFAERGLDVTLDDIAAHAGVGIATVYRRFANRDELVEALFSDRLEALADEAERLAEAPDGWSGITGFLMFSAGQLAVDHGLSDALLRVGRDGEKPDDGSVRTARGRLLPAVEALVGRAQREGTLRPDFAASDVPLLMQMVATAAHLTMPVLPAWWRRPMAVLLDGLAARPEPGTPMPGRSLTFDEVAVVMQSKPERRR